MRIFLTALLTLSLLSSGVTAAPAPVKPPAKPAGTAAPAPAPVAVPPEALPDEELPPPSSAAQTLYSTAKADLLQIRMLIKSSRSQKSVGSGFMIGTSNLVLTNYHVVSEMALDPELYVGEWLDTDGKSGPLELLAVDVLHDLAVVRVNRKGSGVFELPEKQLKLTQGQDLYSLGNPLDLGFGIAEGAFNGVIRFSFYDLLMFTGPINSGMSGGPSVTAGGVVAGINVSKRRDGESVSFLVPVGYAVELLRNVDPLAKPPKDFNAQIGKQLLAHQSTLVERLFSKPMSIKNIGPYKVPVRESEQIRCYGSSSGNKGEREQFAVDSIDCSMQAAVFISEEEQTGHVTILHRYLRSTGLDQVRFASLAALYFRDATPRSRKDRRLTAPKCTEEFINNKALPLRAVLCVRAYRKFADLYDFTVLTASGDDAFATLHSRINVSGVSYDNGMKISRSFIDGISRGAKR
jgi:hypothetical protein